MADRRARSRLVVVAAMVAVGIFCFFLGSRIATPEEAALPVAPEEVVTAPVESRSLSASITGTGTVTASGTEAIVGLAGEGRAGVVSRVSVAPGDSVTWCEAPIEISGRPLMIMQGNVSSYRDLSLGDVGPDVTQLQQALVGCGYPIGRSPDGTFGAGTQRAVLSLYRDLGYSASWIADEDAAELEEKNRAEAQAECEAAQKQPKDAPEGWIAPDPDTIASCIKASKLPSNPEKVIVPQGELAFVPTLGTYASVAQENSPLGDEPVLTIARSGLSLAMKLTPEQRLAVKPGSSVTVADADYQFETTLPEPPAAAEVDDETGQRYFPITIPFPADASPTLGGTQAEFAIHLGDETVYPLAVPVTALFARSDGSTFVTVVTEKEKHDVVVTVDVSLGGYSAITATSGDLSVGDRVVVAQ